MENLPVHECSHKTTIPHLLVGVGPDILASLNHPVAFPPAAAWTTPLRATTRRHDAIARVADPTGNDAIN
jgi:hypothetical protein